MITGMGYRPDYEREALIDIVVSFCKSKPIRFFNRYFHWYVLIISPPVVNIKNVVHIIPSSQLTMGWTVWRKRFHDDVKILKMNGIRVEDLEWKLSNIALVK